MLSETAVKILVVDDEKGIRELLELELGLQGYFVATALNGQEAIEKIKKEKFDIVLCDIKMPKVTGIQVLKESKKHNPDIPVIIMTGYGEEANYNDSIRFGASGFISKPFHIDEVIASVEKAFRK
ncbi:MAG: response regulator [Candidatus Firestonebacteria bacterium]